MKMAKYFLVLCAVILFRQAAFCQRTDSIPANDTIPSFIKGKTTVPLPKPTPVESPYTSDSTVRKKHDPRKATLYSTFLPGLGQIYNRKYWKLPLVAAALGIPAYTYFDNKSEYKKTQFAIAVIATYFSDTTTVVPTIPASLLSQVDPRMRADVIAGQDNPLRNYRNYVRKNEDYSVLFFLLFWGLQIVDATVDAHLKDFDVSDQLSMHFQPSDESLSGAKGFTLAVEIHHARFRPIPLP